MRSKIEFKDAHIKIGDEFVPLGKVEDIKFIKPGEEIPLETTGIDMTGFVVGARNCELTMDMTTPNPLKLMLTLLGIPVVNIIMCKNCKHHDPCGFCERLYKRLGYDAAHMKTPDDFFCGYGELMQKESEE